MNVFTGKLKLFIVIIALVISIPAKAQFDFSLKNVDGKTVSLSDNPNAKGYIIVFTCNHCPFAKLYPKRLNQLNKKYFSKNPELNTDPIPSILDMKNLLNKDEIVINYPPFVHIQ